MADENDPDLVIDDDDDVPQLPSDTLKLLQEFFQEQAAQATSCSADDPASVEVSEDWNLSQFWYDKRTCEILAKEVIKESGGGRIACVSSPSLYKELIKMMPERSKHQIMLLEFDKRFEIYGEDFVFYDYNKPLDLPRDLEKNSFDIVLADPPYLADECLSKTAETVKFLTKEKVLLCTGAIMEESAKKYLDVQPCKFLPRHENNLANEFRVYANYDTSLNSLEFEEKS